MSTRSIVGITYEDGSTASIYVHNDGYPDHMCQVLKHYATLEQVQELIESGDASYLQPTLQDSVFYVDQGDYSPALAHETLTETVISAADCDANYVYIFSAQDKQWMSIDINKGDVNVFATQPQGDPA